MVRRPGSGGEPGVIRLKTGHFSEFEPRVQFFSWLGHEASSGLAMWHRVNPGHGYTILLLRLGTKYVDKKIFCSYYI
ncbi:hypothetical protein SAMN05192555_105194 [Franzmannia pantelleriensis]|uniref:Uncharacterized protein n=1 Tax=Franzmannia pantelleriensis TaxID=48727 RepID=A0A1G9L9F8_9GAMM|nr:hypothetical protein SAMN05192555_105194 [Halomonas pantelleriensis]